MPGFEEVEDLQLPQVFIVDVAEKKSIITQLVKDPWSNRIRQEPSGPAGNIQGSNPWGPLLSSSMGVRIPPGPPTISPIFH